MATKKETHSFKDKRWANLHFFRDEVSNYIGISTRKLIRECKAANISIKEATLEELIEFINKMIKKYPRKEEPPVSEEKYIKQLKHIKVNGFPSGWYTNKELCSYICKQVDNAGIDITSVLQLKTKNK